MNDNIVRKAYNVYAKQDKEITEIAASVPDFDKSVVARIVIELGLAELKQSPLLDRLRSGTVRMIVDGMLQEEREESKRRLSADTHKPQKPRAKKTVSKKAQRR